MNSEHILLLVDESDARRQELCALLSSEYTIYQADAYDQALVQLDQLARESRAVTALILAIPLTDRRERQLLYALRRSEQYATLPIVGVMPSYESAGALDFADVITADTPPALIRKRLRTLVEREKLKKMYEALSGANEQDAVVPKRYAAMTRQPSMVEQLLHAMNAGMLVCDDDAAFTLHYFHDNVCNMLGYSRAELWEFSEGSLINLIHPEDRAQIVEKVHQTLSREDSYHCEYRIYKKDGDCIWVQDSGRRFRDPQGKMRLSVVLTDITPLISVTQTMRYRADFDRLTGIYNKTTFLRKTRELLLANPDTKYWIVLLDIGRFKVINDLFGMDVGDALLRAIGHALYRELSRVGTFGRMHADNFVLCIPADWIAPQTLVDTTSNMLRAFPIDFEIIPSFGIYAVEDARLPVDQMCDRARLALRTIKGNYVRRFAFFNTAMREAILREQSIVNDMSNALERGQFEVFFQPQFNHATGEVTGAEALVRWNHPVRGLVSPGEFIPVFEKNGFITRMDEYVWEKACAWLRAWIDRGNAPLPISVNVARADLYVPNLGDQLLRMLNRYDLSPSLLKLEITESSYAENPAQLLSAVQALRARGFSILMDDFGSGYSSLNMLKDIPVDLLKIDLRFLSGAGHAGKGGNILNAVVRMSRWLNVHVLAEGVETREQADFLKSIGCELMQGYYYAKPMPQGEFEALLSRVSYGSAQPDSVVLSATDAEQLWDPHSQSALVFQTFVGAAAIFDTCGDNIEVLRVNDQFYQTVGTRPGSLAKYSRQIQRFLAPEDLPVLRAALQRANDTGAAQVCEVRYCRSGQSKEDCRWLRLRLRAIARSNTHNVYYTLLDNITDHKRHYAQLRTQMRRVHALLCALPAGVGVYRLRKGVWEICYANAALKRLYGGGGIKRLHEQDVLSVVHPADVPAFRVALGAIQQSDHTFRHTFRLAKQGKSERWIALRGRKLDEREGDPMFCGVSLDVTEHEASTQYHEAMLAEQNRLLRVQKFEEQRYRFLVEQTGAVVFEWNLEDGSFFHSEGYEHFEMSRKNPDDLLHNRAKTDTVHPDDLPLLLDFYRQTRSGARYAQAVLRLKKTDGSYVWCRMTGSFIPGEDGKPMRTIGSITTIDKEVCARRALESTTSTLQNLLHNLPAGVGIYELKGAWRSLYISDQALRILGYTRAEYDALTQTGIPIFSEFAALRNPVYVTPKDAPPIERTYTLSRKDGTVIWIRTLATVRRNAEGVRICYATFVNVTDGVETSRKLRWQEERLRILAQSAGTVTFDYDPANDVLTYTAAPPGKPLVERVISHYLERLHEDTSVHPSSLDAYKAALREASRTPTRGTLEYLVDNFGTGYRWSRGQYASVADEDGRTFRVVGRVDDIHEEKLRALEEQRALEAEREQYRRDAVTGLWCRAALEEQIRRALECAPGTQSAFLLLDVDNFKAVNDTYGHPSGDRFLRDLADAAQACIRAGDIAGRLGGDEFALLLRDVSDPQIALSRAQKLMRVCERKQSEYGWTVPTTISVGIAMAPRQGTAFAQLFKNADAALYRAKAAGKNRVIQSDANDDTKNAR